MQTKRMTSSVAYSRYTGLSAIVAGSCYTSRWVWELSESILKNKQYPPSFVSQNFFVVKVLLMVALAGIFFLARTGKRVRFGVLAACMGLLWTSVTRTLEAYGVPGAWGFYSSPGLLMFFIGSFTLGLAIARNRQFPFVGRVVMAIAFFYFLGGLSSMLLYNVLGRTESANSWGSVVANLFLIAEGACWIILGMLLFFHGKYAAKSEGDRMSAANPVRPVMQA